LPHLLGPDQQSLVPGVARLTTAFLAWLVGWRRRTAFTVKAIRRGRQRGVARVDVQPDLGVGQLLLQLADLLLLLVDNGLEVFDLGVKTTDSACELFNVPLGIGAFQFGDASPEKTQVSPDFRRGAFQGFLIDHEVRRHTIILCAPALLRPIQGMNAYFPRDGRLIDGVHSQRVSRWHPPIY